MTEEHGQALQALGRSMSAADRSLLTCALADLAHGPSVMLTTMPGSNNDLLWSEIVDRGWLDRASPLEAAPAATTFLMKAKAAAPVSAFLADVEHSAQMTQIVNELRSRIPPQLIGAVREADGTPADLAIALAGVVESTMRRAIKPSLHDEFLQEVTKVAEGMRTL